MPVKALKECNVSLNGDVILLSVLEEECGGNGALSCLETGIYRRRLHFARTNAVYMRSAARAVIWVRMKVFGMSGHVLKSHECVNAFENALKLIDALKKTGSGIEQNGKQASGIPGASHTRSTSISERYKAVNGLRALWMK